MLRGYFQVKLPLARMPFSCCRNVTRELLLIGPGQQGGEHVLAVSIDGDVRLIENGLILQGEGQITRQGLGDLNENVLFGISACGQISGMIQEDALDMVVGSPVHFIVESKAEVIPRKHSLSSNLQPIS